MGAPHRDNATAAEGQLQAGIHPPACPPTLRPLQLPSVLGDPFSPEAEDLSTSPHFIPQSYSPTHTQPQEVRAQSTPFHQGKVRLREVEGLAPSKQPGEGTVLAGRLQRP